MKAAVTGASGFVGRAVLHALGQAGHEAVALVRSAPPGTGARAIGDLADGPIDPAVLGAADTVIHLAARTHVTDETMSDAMAAYRATNVTGTGHLVDAAVAAGVTRFVYMSSVKAVGERTIAGRPMTPETTPRPEDPYGITKLEAEALVRERCNAAGIAWTILRPPLVYGPGVKANFDRLIALVERRLPMPLASIRNRRSIVYVDNLADATVAAAVAPGTRNRILTLCDDTLSTPDLIRAVAEALGIKPVLLPFPPALLTLAGQITGRTAMVDRLAGSLEIDPRSSMAAADWQPQIDTHQGLRRTINARR